MSVENDAHRRRSEMEYLLAYEEWEARLTPEQRLKLGKAATPDIDESSRMQTGAAADVAESSMASYSVDLGGLIDGPVEELQEKFHMPGWLAVEVAKWSEARVEREAEARKARTIVKIAGVFLQASNVKTQAAGLAYACDLALTSGLGSMREFAAALGLSVEAISRPARWWRKELGLPTGSHMKGDDHCEKLSKAQHEKHWRKKSYGE